MPIIPSVFRPIRSNDVQTRVFKTYKSYTLTSGSASGSGYRTHAGIHNKYAINVGDNTYNYPLNSDGTNQHVAWRWLDHRYYRYPYDPARSHEHTNRNKTEKFLFYSSSALTIPYFEVGERIKPGTFTVTTRIENSNHPATYELITLLDDGNGNLRDPLVQTSSFATSSRCFFYMGFNSEFQQFDSNFGYIETGSVEYILNSETKYALATGVSIAPGVELNDTAIKYDASGLSCGKLLTAANYGNIRIPHHESFNNFNKCDRWTISLWYRHDAFSTVNGIEYLLAKGVNKQEQYLDLNGQIQTRVVTDTWPVTGISTTLLATQLSTRRIPFLIGKTQGTADPAAGVFFICSNGSESLIITASNVANADVWYHLAVVNDNNNVKLYVDGVAYQSASMIDNSTANDYDIELLSVNGLNTYAGLLDEIRMYDYALTDNEIASLSGRHYLSASLYQTNVVGNVYYRNGQVTVSSVIPHYNAGWSAYTTNRFNFFNTPFTASYRGTHTVYENEVLVRIPADQFNYTLNPSATYRPGTDGSNNNCNTTPAGAESNNGPGDLYISSFVSGTVGPYITTVGLYNDQQQLLAVGKLGTAITKRSDIDTNIIIRWDY